MKIVNNTDFLSYNKKTLLNKEETFFGGGASTNYGCGFFLNIEIVNVLDLSES